jgi:hypothetical protein
VRAALVGLAGLLVCALAAAEESGDQPRYSSDYVQAWLGALDTEGGWEMTEPGTGESLMSDVGTLPFAGGAGQRLWGNGALRYGFEGGGIASFKSDRWRFLSSNGTLRVSVDSSLLSLGVFMGGLVSLHLGAHVRVYAAAGPSLTWAWLETDDMTDEGSGSGAVVGGGSVIIIDGEDTSSDVSFAPYARLGVEFEFDNGFSVGASARYADDEFDFGDQGEIVADDVLWLLTLGARL